jgi:hypothetical protein
MEIRLALNGCGSFASLKRIARVLVRVRPGAPACACRHVRADTPSPYHPTPRACACAYFVPLALADLIIFYRMLTERNVDRAEEA